MIYIISIFIISTLLAYFGQKKLVGVSYDERGVPHLHTKYRVQSYAFFCILVLLVLFVGLRSSFNDTAAYIAVYTRLDAGWDAIKDFSWSVGGNPGFKFSNTLMKTFISENAQVMLFFWSFVTIVLFLNFYRQWSDRFWLTVFLYFGTGMLLFSMAALKQVLAMSIGLYGITCLLKNQRALFVACILLGSTFHIYLLLYLVAFFLMDRAWSGKMVFVVLGAILCGVFIESFVQVAYQTTEFLGAEYAKSDAISGQGLNIFRFMVYCVTPVLTWIYRKKINNSGNVVLILFSNLVLIGWSFMFIALFISANMFARMGMYFDPFMHLTLTTLLVGIIPRKNQVIVMMFCVVSFSLYFFYQINLSNFSY